MALTLQDLLDGNRKLLQKDVMESTQTRMSVSELRQLTAEQLKPVEKTAEEVTEISKDSSENIRLAKEMQDGSKQTNDLLKQTVKLLSSSEAREIKRTALERNHYKGVRERFGERAENAFSVRSLADMLGVVKRGTGGIFDTLLAKREEKKAYIEARGQIDPDKVKELGGPRAARKFFADEFKQQQEIQKQLRINERQISRLEKLGFSQEQIDKTPSGKRAIELASQLKSVDVRLQSDDENKEEQIARDEDKLKTAKEQTELTGQQIELQQTSGDFLEKIYGMMKDLLDTVKGGSGIGSLLPALPAAAPALGKTAGKLGSLLKTAAPVFGTVGLVTAAGFAAAAPFLMDENGSKGNPNETGDYKLSKPISEMTAYERFFGKVGAKRQSIEEMIEAGATFTPEEAADIKKYYEIDVPGFEAKQVEPPKAPTGTLENVTAPPPATANAIYNRSAENAGVSASNVQATSNTVVAPTTINNKNERLIVKTDVRNKDSSYTRLIDSRFVPA